MSLKTFIFLSIYLYGVCSFLIETSFDEENVCDFDDRRLAETVRFIRSRFSCRVYHVCAFYKQYTLTCSDGLYFDEDTDSCNFQDQVYCSLPEEELSDQEQSNIVYHTNQVEHTTQFIESSISVNQSFTESLNQTLELISTTPLTNILNETEYFTEGVNNSSSTFDNESEFLFSTILDHNLKISEGVENSSWWLGPVDCIEGFDHKISHNENCGLYYECTKDGQKIEKSCPYPLQYDELLNECRFYDLIECGHRKQAKSLCDYQLSSPQPSTIPCEMYPNCKDLSDGLYPSNDCRHYYQCKDERTLRIYSCPKDKKTGSQLKFNFLTKRCDIIENVSYMCGGYAIPIDVYTNKMVCPLKHYSKSNEQPSLETRDLYFSHPSECHLYVTCDNMGSLSILECYNGTHFSPHYQSCVHPSVANCKKYHTIDETHMNFSLKSLLFETKVKTGFVKEKISEQNPTETSPVIVANLSTFGPNDMNMNSTNGTFF